MDDLLAFIIIFSLVKVLIVGAVLLVRWGAEVVGAGLNPPPPGKFSDQTPQRFVTVKSLDNYGEPSTWMQEE